VRRVKRLERYNASNTLIHAWCDICEAPNIKQTADEKRLNYSKRNYNNVVTRI
jgi:hypothetical protein